MLEPGPDSRELSRGYRAGESTRKGTSTRKGQPLKEIKISPNFNGQETCLPNIFVPIFARHKCRDEEMSTLVAGSE